MFRPFLVIVSVLVTSPILGCSHSKPAARPQPVDANAGRPQRPVPPRAQGDVTVTADTGDDLSWLSPVYFKFDSAELLPGTRETLARLHDWMTSHAKVKLTIEGHCDEQGTTEYNIALGQRRAQAMVDYLGRLGTNVARLAPTSFGSERPAVEGHDELAWSKNRRGEFRLDR